MLKKILVPKVYLPIIYLGIAFLIYFIINKIITKALKVKRKVKTSSLHQKREATIVNLIKSIVKYIIAIFTILAILGVYGIETTSIIASLGIAGAIIGLAFQDTIKNLLSGIAIIFDNHYMQGDVVTINGFRGEVIELGLQTTKLKSYSGEVMIINNSLITSVINHSMYNNLLYIEFPVSKEVSLKTLESILHKVNKKMQNIKEVTKDMELLGIESMDGNKYYYKVLIECAPESQFNINRKFMEYLKEGYESVGISVPGDYLEIKNRKE